MLLWQVHLHDPHDIANVQNAGVAASLAAHTLLDIRQVLVSLIIALL